MLYTKKTFCELYGAKPSFINVIFFLAAIGVLKEIIKSNLSLI